MTTPDPAPRDPSETGSSPPGLVVRPADDAELPAIIELAGRALRWDPDRPNDALFRWKHRENPAGRSPMWVAEEESRLVGVRTFLRWRFQRDDGTEIEAARAVDTATEPSQQGRGIFSRLTRQALRDLERDGVHFVFNTPNEQSRPGYLKLGWRVAGRLPIAVRPRPSGLGRLARARTPAQRWSLPTESGQPAAEAFTTGPLADEEGLRRLLGRPAPGRIATRVDLRFLRWRYGFGPLHYRVLLAGDEPDEGFAVYRRRRRGAAVEVTVCELALPPDIRRGQRRAFVSRLARVSEADYLIRAGGPLLAVDGFVRLPDQGPIVTLRDVAAPAPPFSAFDLRLGDIELF